MIRLNFNQPLLSFKGETQKTTLGDILAELISTETKGNIVKLYGWMQRLAAAKDLELDEADYSMFKDLIENSERITVLVKAQVLKVMAEEKERLNGEHDREKVKKAFEVKQ